MKKTASIALALILAAAHGAGPAAAEGGRLDVIRSGKERFEKACGFCHNLERSLTKVKSLEEWSLTVKRMVTYGAPLNTAQRDAVSAYLGARSLFDRSCNSCHDSLRVLAKPAKDVDWAKTVQRMGGHLDELAKGGSEMKHLSQQEIEDVAALLTVIVPQD